MSAPRATATAGLRAGDGGSAHPAGRAVRLAAAGGGQRQCGTQRRARGRSVHHGSRGAASVLPREGDDIEIQVPITVSEAGLGAKIEVPTIDGRALLKVPQGTQNGQKFRLREKGVMNSRKNRRGDEIVEVVIQAPKVQDERTRELLRELAQVNTEDPRQELWSKV